MNKIRRLKKEIEQRNEDREILNIEQQGFLEAEENEKTLKFRQEELKQIVQIDTSNNVSSHISLIPRFLIWPSTTALIRLDTPGTAPIWSWEGKKAI